MQTQNTQSWVILVGAMSGLLQQRDSARIVFVEVSHERVLLSFRWREEDVGVVDRIEYPRFDMIEVEHGMQEFESYA